MERKDVFIIACPACGVKNRIKSFGADKKPVCAKCKTPLVDNDKSEAHSRYSKMVDNFYNLPDLGDRSK